MAIKLKSLIERVAQKKSKQLPENSYQLDMRLSDLPDEYVLFKNEENGTVVESYYNGRNWSEGSVDVGETPYGWGSKKYQGYLTLQDVINYLTNDYGGDWNVYEE